MLPLLLSFDGILIYVSSSSKINVQMRVRRNGLTREDEIITIRVLVCSFALGIRNWWYVTGGCLWTYADDEKWVRSLARFLSSACLESGFRTPTRTSELHLEKGTVSMNTHHTLRVWVKNKRLLLHYALALDHTRARECAWVHV